MPSKDAHYKTGTTLKPGPIVPAGPAKMFRRILGRSPHLNMPSRNCLLCAQALFVVQMAMVHGKAAAAAALSSSPSLCQLESHLHHGLSRSGPGAVWFADVGEKVFQHDTAPSTPCGSLRLAGARGEHVMFQLAVRAPAAALQGVQVHATFCAAEGHVAGVNSLGVGVFRAGFTNVTTPANNVTSKGVGMYADPLLYPDDAVVFPGGGGMVPAGTTAVFWVTLALPAKGMDGGVYRGALTVSGTGVVQHPIELQVYNFTLPDAAHASQWTESDPFGSLISCNTIAEAMRNPNCPPDNHTDFPKYMKPCLAASTVDAYYQEMAAHRVNRMAWVYDFDFANPVGLTIAPDAQSVVLDTEQFDATFTKLVAMGYRDIRFPTPACLTGSSCGLPAASGVSPNASWVFGNSSSGWYGNCITNSTDGTLRGGAASCVSGFSTRPIIVPIFKNASLNTPSERNASLASWQTQVVGDAVELNPEFVRLFRLIMVPMAKHMRAKGWINRTFAFITDEPRWPCYSGTNFTVNAWVAMAKLYRSLDPSIRVQQDLTPQQDGATWDAVSPYVDAWVWQEGQFQYGVQSGTGEKAKRIEAELGLVAKARKAGADAYIYNNEIAVVDLPNHRIRTFPWQIWRTNYAYPVSRHQGLQGSLSWYTDTGYFGSDPYKFANVQCERPAPGGSGSAHPTHQRPGHPEPPCQLERAAGLWFTMYPPSDGDICHKGPTTSVRWELLRQGLEDVEYLAMLDRLAGKADLMHGCGYEDAVCSLVSSAMVQVD